jgi:hypothetical protein
MAVVWCVALAATLSACSKGSASVHGAVSDVQWPTVVSRGVTVSADVSPESALDLRVKGIGRIVFAAGSVASAGKILVTPVESTRPETSLVTVSGIGFDVSFEGTSLAAPVSVIFDDPAIAGLVPKDALPVVLHEAAGAWDFKAVSKSAGDGPLVLVTKDFSINVFGWIKDLISGFGDSLADMVAQRTDPRVCAGGAPVWSGYSNGTTLVHLCSVTNVDAKTGTPRAELQVQSNRRFLQWVSVPAGYDYLWVDEQPDLLRSIIARLTGTNAGERVLLAGNGWFTAGFRQPGSAETKQFDAFPDATSAFLSIAQSVIGLDFSKKPHGIVMAFARCAAGIVSATYSNLKDFIGEKAKDFILCVLEAGLSNLSDPDRALQSAIDLFGDSAYAKTAQEQLKSAASRLNKLGRVLKLLGPLGVITATYPQLPDVASTWGNDHPGRFTLTLVAGTATAPGGGNPPPGQPGGGGQPGSYNGRVIRVAATGTTYWVDYSGTRHWIPDGETYFCLVARYGAVVDGLTQAQANGMPEGAAAARCLDPARLEGKIIRARPSLDAWLVSGGVRRPVGWTGSGIDPFVRDETVYCLAAQGHSLVDNLTQEQAESLPGGTIGPACLDPNRFKNKVVRNSSTSESYFVDSTGTRRWIQDGESYFCLTGRGYPVVNIGYGFLIETIPAGASYPRCLDPERFRKTIIVVDATSTSYFVDGSGHLHWIPDGTVFSCLSGSYPVRRGFTQEQADSLGNGQPWATC